MKNEIESLLERLKINARFGEPVAPELIPKFEEKLKVILPNSYKDFLIEVGFLVAGGNDYLGFFGNDFEAYLTFIGETLDRRHKEAIPDELVIVHDDEDFGLVCLNTKKYIDGECEIIRWDPWQKEEIEVEAQSYKEYLFNDLASMSV